MHIKALTLLVVLLSPVPVLAQQAEQTPLSVVNKRTKALADHDFSEFMSTYAEDVQLFVYPDKLLGKGKEHVRMLFAPMFKDGNIEVQVAHQLVSDGFVVCESTISFSDKSETTIAIYEVRNGLIQSVRFVRDNLRASQSRRGEGTVGSAAKQ